MDRILEREERKKLVELLGIDPVLYGNIPVMKSAYKRASKVLHPDKGGTGNDMMILNFLWQKFQEGVTEARCPEVRGAFWFHSELFQVPLIEFCGGIDKFMLLFLKTPQCLLKGRTSCNCITSLLLKQHADRKLLHKKRCLVWGECFCYYCFALWFGFEQSWTSFEFWKRVIAETPVQLLLIADQLLNH
ncbi:small T antigen [Alphapolyomavirus callosciuri]|uniref:Small T antigen n=1 Tax=Alphapolyomavirus callosciuri TaxID=2721748 RepID=A0A6G9LWU8_9POLY|nr:small T antigen [Alphapolyomavirus callosciuri]QIQ69322.1 small T antigen [Alphapolyomavirus callosciuri]QIQ69326.1 small T antigen [Alphapolyomavirus callosciuri]QIQ69330.1 small T antigen [Alphapolyomavirus callosciuri]